MDGDLLLLLVTVLLSPKDVPHWEGPESGDGGGAGGHGKVQQALMLLERYSLSVLFVLCIYAQARENSCVGAGLVMEMFS